MGPVFYVIGNGKDVKSVTLGLLNPVSGPYDTVRKDSVYVKVTFKHLVPCKIGDNNLVAYMVGLVGNKLFVGIGVLYALRVCDNREEGCIGKA